MRVNVDTVNDYLSGKDLNNYSNQWIFKSIEKDKYLIEKVSENKRDTIKKITYLLQKELVNFKPYNIEIWNLIFPRWESIINSSLVYLVVGCPNPYDAMTRVSPKGEEAIIIDINRMLSYVNKGEEVIDIIKNLFTHEYAHTCIHCKYPPLNSTEDLENIQYLCFDEGIAHFLSFDKDIKTVQWHSNVMKDRKKNAYNMLKVAITQKQDNKEILEKANSGPFWEKFGAISGLFTISDAFVESKYNYDSIVELYNRGPKEFLIDIFKVNNEEKDR
ncbi:hypothetical protein [Hathewaya limosa]|uniref:DUF2268 domain-containing protein n=1 Tax=Hathewaya limosa TaxID=1536 RepID=A0ABU0JS45_HATLI|nr:hypothetical protein [Hathewaya limosa]MDQ0479893.1 hypothetical protein [Hathewaya limosa]